MIAMAAAYFSYFLSIDGKQNITSLDIRLLCGGILSN